MKVLWFTGLSGSGKTTIVDQLKEILKEQGKTVEILDGDDVRERLHTHLGFTPEDIKENNKLILGLVEKDLDNFDHILVPVISPFKESRQNARNTLGENYSEIYVKASIDACIERDVKGLYKKALAGEIPNFIGIAEENPYEEPENPELTLDTENETVEESVKKVLDFIANNE